MKHRAIAVLAAMGLLTGCTLGPKYQRPAVSVPQSFLAPEALPTAEAASLADLKWWQVFRDEDLQRLIRTALDHNYDLREAVGRVEAAQANLGITRSDQFPQAPASLEFCIFRSSFSPIPQRVEGFFECVHRARGR
jgi:outer membrane protein, multidrug efflux system